tara:strand:- start:92 stop:298 length:207 start_codon:yes stop_codon:yes gene_type:complete
MKRFLTLFAGILRSIADSLEKSKKDVEVEVDVTADFEVDVMADVDDQRAHHFGTPKDFDELDDQIKSL